MVVFVFVFLLPSISRAALGQSYGARPYGDMDAFEVVARVAQGYRLPPPSTCPPAVDAVMQECWSAAWRDRPTFAHIVPRLEAALAPQAPARRRRGDRVAPPPRPVAPPVGAAPHVFGKGGDYVSSSHADDPPPAAPQAPPRSHAPRLPRVVAGLIGGEERSMQSSGSSQSRVALLPPTDTPSPSPPAASIVPPVAAPRPAMMPPQLGTGAPAPKPRPRPRPRVDLGVATPDDSSGMDDSTA